MTDSLLKPETTFEDLCVMYGTGKSYTVVSNSRGTQCYYRHGQMTRLGDIERAEWCALMKELITREGEERLQAQLLDWYRQDGVHHTQTDLELQALEAHAARIFDDEAWVDFISFNQRYRPEVLKTATLVSVIFDCCDRSGVVTQKQIEHPLGGTAYCPYCGRYTAVRMDMKGEAHD